MKQEEIMQVFRGYFNYIKRPGADDLLQWMDANGFFEAPASKRHHGAEPGGLAKHSVNVFKRLIRLNAEEEERQESLNYKLETLAICGLLGRRLPPGSRRRRSHRGARRAGNGKGLQR